MNISIHKGSIFEVEADAIVNPANSFLNHAGGLARVIAQAATAEFSPFPLDQWTTGFDGSPTALMRAARAAHNDRVALWIADHEAAPLIAVGNAHHTSPGALNFKGVIHVVGPIWSDDNFMERDLLELAHESILRCCYGQGYTSVVIPAVSCGVFGFPVEMAAKIAVEVAHWGAEYGVTDVTFALTDEAHVAAYEAALYV